MSEATRHDHPVGRCELPPEHDPDVPCSGKCFTCGAWLEDLGAIERCPRCHPGYVPPSPVIDNSNRPFEDVRLPRPLEE